MELCPPPADSGWPQHSLFSHIFHTYLLWGGMLRVRGYLQNSQAVSKIPFDDLQQGCRVEQSPFPFFLFSPKVKGAKG